LWNEDSIGVATMIVAASNDPAFNTFTALGTFNPTANALGADYAAQLFSLAETTARYVRLVVTAPVQPGGSQAPDWEVSIGEVAFSEIAGIPEPRSWMLMGLGLVAMVLGRSVWMRRAVRP